MLIYLIYSCLSMKVGKVTANTICTAVSIISGSSVAEAQSKGGRVDFKSQIPQETKVTFVTNN